MTDSSAPFDLRAETTRRFFWRRIGAMGIPAAILLYFTYVVFAFDVPALVQRANWDNGRALVADSYSHKVHVTRDNRDGEVTVSIEGERRGTYPEGESPDWVTLGEDTFVDLGDGHVVHYLADGRVTYDIPDFGLVEALPSRSGVSMTWPEGVTEETHPDWINAGANRVAITTEAGRLTITRNRTEVFRYFMGWELFWFTLDSPYHGMRVLDLAGRAVSGEFGAIVSDVWNNQMWRHSDVAWAIFETLLMAFLGTIGAAIVALPLAFLAARNFTPVLALRFVGRRLFDFLRGVDALIWTIILSRAFGLGPLTGSLAIVLTDSGSLGKLFSEALENVDDKEIDGVQSTGAKPLQKYRFGVIPQIMPVLLSQVLYFLESNTRSATIIGAITGGGIGLLLTQAINTQKDWEEVTYYIILVLLMVILMDWLSGILRRRLIGGSDSGH